MLITEETQVINFPFPPEINIMSSCIVTMHSSTNLYMLCDHRAFMSPVSCSKILSTAGKTCHIHLRQSRPYQPRACIIFRLSLRIDPFLRWPALKKFQLDPPYEVMNLSFRKDTYEDIVREIKQSICTYRRDGK